MEKNLTNRDWCLSPDEEKVFKASPQALANSNGELTLSQIEVFENSFAKNIVADSESNPVVLAVNKYGDTFADNLNLINNTINTNTFVTANIQNYTLLQTRILNGPISQIEFAQFLKEYNYSPISANFSANQNPPKFLRELDDFYRGSYADSVLGGFCSLMPNVFGAIGGFFIIIGQVEGLIGDALSFISKIRNIEDPLKALFEAIKVKALIEAIKKKITDAVMGTINKIKDAIQNFNMADIMGNVESFIQDKIVGKVEAVKDQIGRFFSEENLNKIQSKLKGMIDYAVGLFDNPSLEEIMFLMARICGFAAGVEAIIKGVKSPLDAIADEYETARNTIRSATGQVTSRIVEAGGIRFSDEERARRTREAYDVWTAPNDDIVTTSLPDVDLETDATRPPPMQVPDWIASQEGYGREYIPTWDEIKDNNHPVFNPVGGWVRNIWPGESEPILGSLGWTGGEHTMTTKIYILRLNKRMNELHPGFGSFRINSLYRNEKYQRYLRDIKKYPGVALHSQHLLGKAVDIAVSSWTRQMRTDLVNEGRKIGFTSFGFYPTKNFIHLDWRAQSDARTWVKPEGARW